MLAANIKRFTVQQSVVHISCETCSNLFPPCLNPFIHVFVSGKSLPAAYLPHLFSLPTNINILTILYVFAQIFSEPVHPLAFPYPFYPLHHYHFHIIFISRKKVNIPDKSSLFDIFDTLVIITSLLI